MSGLQNYVNGMTGVDVYQRLKEDIISLELKPGQMISENEIANIYNVSRTPIKNAFLRLKGEKYIEIIPQKGTFVTLLDMKSIKDIVYMRAVLEMDVIESIIKNGLTKQVIANLTTILEKQLSLIESKDITPLSFYEIDSEFHQHLFKTVDRERMWDVIQDCQVYYSRFRLLDTMTTARYQELYKDHSNILSALKKEDIEQLKTYVFDHLHGSFQTLAGKIEGEYRGYFIKYD